VAGDPSGNRCGDPVSALFVTVCVGLLFADVGVPGVVVGPAHQTLAFQRGQSAYHIGGGDGLNDGRVVVAHVRSQRVGDLVGVSFSVQPTDGSRLENDWFGDHRHLSTACPHTLLQRGDDLGVHTEVVVACAVKHDRHQDGRSGFAAVVESVEGRRDFTGYPCFVVGVVLGASSLHERDRPLATVIKAVRRASGSVLPLLSARRKIPCAALADR